VFLRLDLPANRVFTAGRWRERSRRFPAEGRTNHQPEQERIAYLEKKVQTKDFSYLNVCATFYYLCRILDGYSRFLVRKIMASILPLK
jgi:transposase InsO family protein